MERAQQQLSVYGSSGSPSQRDLRMARGNSTGGIYTGNIFTPLTDTESVDRLSLLAPENSGYYENHHCIQRHKVIPSDSLQHTIFPWATTMLNTVSKDIGADEKRGFSRFQDFLLDLRIVLLQCVTLPTHSAIVSDDAVFLCLVV
ncbi:hypothetical protein BX070DRAFT_236173 [Coemansia spiralis]|nr:hypothetical protein BX070DRAFT_236173 [Coemansia spiralis]